MKFDWRDWRVILGTGVVVLIVISSYFGLRWRYQLADERLKPPPPISNIPATPTVRGNQPDSDSEMVGTKKTPEPPRTPH